MKIDRINRIHELLKDVHNISINDLCDTFQVSGEHHTPRYRRLEQQDSSTRKSTGGIVTHEPSGNQNALSPPRETTMPITVETDCPHGSRLRPRRRRHLHRLRHDHDAHDPVPDGEAPPDHRHGERPRHQCGIQLQQPQRPRDGRFALHPVGRSSRCQVIQVLRRYNISKVFLASTGISLEHGATNASPPLPNARDQRCLVRKGLPEHFPARRRFKFDISLMSCCAPRRCSTS